MIKTLAPEKRAPLTISKIDHRNSITELKHVTNRRIWKILSRFFLGGSLLTGAISPGIASAKYNNAPVERRTSVSLLDSADGSEGKSVNQSETAEAVDALYEDFLKSLAPYMSSYSILETFRDPSSEWSKKIKLHFLYFTANQIEIENEELINKTTQSIVGRLEQLVTIHDEFPALGSLTIDEFLKLFPNYFVFEPVLYSDYELVLNFEEAYFWLAQGLSNSSLETDDSEASTQGNGSTRISEEEYRFIQRYMDLATKNISKQDEASKKLDAAWDVVLVLLELEKYDLDFADTLRITNFAWESFSRSQATSEEEIGEEGKTVDEGYFLKEMLLPYIESMNQVYAIEAAQKSSPHNTNYLHSFGDFLTTMDAVCDTYRGKNKLGEDAKQVFTWHNVMSGENQEALQKFIASYLAYDVDTDDKLDKHVFITPPEFDLEYWNIWIEIANKYDLGGYSSQVYSQASTDHFIFNFLQSYREKGGIEQGKSELDTLIKSSYIKALEEGIRYDQLPGFISFWFGVVLFENNPPDDEFYSAQRLLDDSSFTEAARIYAYNPDVVEDLFGAHDFRLGFGNTSSMLVTAINLGQYRSMPGVLNQLLFILSELRRNPDLYTPKQIQRAQEDVNSPIAEFIKRELRQAYWNTRNQQGRQVEE